MIHEIVWPDQPIKAQDYAKILAAIQSSRDYSPVPPGTPPSWATALSEECGHRVSTTQILLMQDSIRKDMIIASHAEFASNKDKHIEDYESGKSIVEIAKTVGAAPLTVLRGILRHLGVSRNTISDLITHKISASEVLDNREAHEFAEAESADAESYYLTRHRASVAAHNEDLVVDHFREAGVAMRTQEDLVAEQTETHGRAVNTPDMLFVDDVLVNGRKVAWLEYKDYVGLPSGLLHDSAKKQVARYVAEWGYGVICYRGNYVEGLNYSGAGIVSGLALDIEYIQ